MKHWRWRTLGVLLVCGVVVLAEKSAVPTLKMIAMFDLPGPPDARFDYLKIDPEDHYLFSAHLGASQVYVIDLLNNKVIATIANLPGVEGIEYVPELKKVYTSNAGDDTLGVINVQQLKVIRRIATEAKPDGMTYARPFHKLYVSDERAKAEAVVDVRTDAVVKTIHFQGETGVPQYDPVLRRVFVNLQTQNMLAVIDPDTDEVVAQYPVGDCQGNHGMALDSAHHRAFLVCEGNHVMTVFDLLEHRAVVDLPLASGADVVQFDAGMRRIYVACSSGVISVFRMDDPDHYRKLEDFAVGQSVHSLAVDSRTHRVYTPEQEEGGQGVARMLVYEALRVN